MNFGSIFKPRVRQIAATAAGGPATLDPTSKTSLIVMSNGDLTATVSGVPSQEEGVRSYRSFSSGKVGFKVTRVVTGDIDIGFMDASVTPTNIAYSGGSTHTVVQEYGGSGNKVMYNSTTPYGTGMAGLAAGNYELLVYDVALQRFWGYNSVSAQWNNAAIGSENPATGTGGASAPLTGSIYAYIGLWTNGAQLTVDLNPITDPAWPSGFTGIAG